LTRVHEYALNDRKINYNFKTSLLVKDMLIGLEQIGLDENDEVVKSVKSSFRSIRMKLKKTGTSMIYSKFTAL
jgi:hypothetical protein